MSHTQTHAETPTPPPPWVQPAKKKNRNGLAIALIVFLIGIPVLLFGACSAVFVGAATTAGNALIEASDAPAPTLTGGTGQAFVNAGMTYEVTSAKVSRSLPAFFGDNTAKDGASFVKVEMTITNDKNETKIFSSSNSVVRSSDGLSFSPTTDYTFDLKGDDLLFKEVQPGLPTSGVLVFEVPTDKAAGSTLVIEDVWGNGQIVVDLGL